MYKDRGKEHRPDRGGLGGQKSKAGQGSGNHCSPKRMSITGRFISCEGKLARTSLLVTYLPSKKSYNKSGDRDLN